MNSRRPREVVAARSRSSSHAHSVSWPPARAARRSAPSSSSRAWTIRGASDSTSSGARYAPQRAARRRPRAAAARRARKSACTSPSSRYGRAASSGPSSRRSLRHLRARGDRVALRRRRARASAARRSARRGAARAARGSRPGGRRASAAAARRSRALRPWRPSSSSRSAGRVERRRAPGRAPQQRAAVLERLGERLAPVRQRDRPAARRAARSAPPTQPAGLGDQHAPVAVDHRAAVAAERRACARGRPSRSRSSSAARRKPQRVLGHARGGAHEPEAVRVRGAQRAADVDDAEQRAGRPGRGSAPPSTTTRAARPGSARPRRSARRGRSPAPCRSRSCPRCPRSTACPR